MESNYLTAQDVINRRKKQSELIDDLLESLKQMVYDTPRGADINYMAIVDKARAVIARAERKL